MKDDSKVLSTIIVGSQILDSKNNYLCCDIDCLEFYSKKILNIHAITSMSQAYNHVFLAKLFFIEQVLFLAGTILTKFVSFVLVEYLD